MNRPFSYVWMLVLSLAVPSYGCSAESGVVVTVEGIGAPSMPIASLQLDGIAIDGDWMQTSTFGPQDGQSEIVLPATLGLRLRGGPASVEGQVEVCATSNSPVGSPLASACSVVDVIRDEVAEVDVILDFGLAGDAGADGGLDGGVSCGNGVIDTAEDCDSADLGGADCTSLGFVGGSLGCGSDCAFDVSGCSGPPTVPVLRGPMNGAYFGNVHVPMSLRPVFSWEASLVGSGKTVQYELEYSMDPAFPPAMTMGGTTMSLTYQPAFDLSVSAVPPWVLATTGGSVPARPFVRATPPPGT